LALGWKQRYSLLQGIAQTAQWWIHRKDLSSKETSEL
jgi:nucleoside-diphosphate-sugar epimerase